MTNAASPCIAELDRSPDVEFSRKPRLLFAGHARDCLEHRHKLREVAAVNRELAASGKNGNCCGKVADGLVSSLLNAIEKGFASFEDFC